jgi:Na+(H+)/acetate symporter ActP
VQLNIWALVAVLGVAVVTFSLGHYSSRFSVSAHDFLVARRTVRSRRNAAAIAGEYLSAASFLGVAGIVLKDGVDGLWYPIGFTAGYLALMLFVAAPLRRSGAYTLPDFLEARLDSPQLRRFATFVVVVIGILYLIPQLQGAGLALGTILPVPSWAGAVAVMVVVVLNVVGGGMQAITVVQAFQYWLKLFALAVPAFVLCAVYVFGPGDGGELGRSTPPTFGETTTVDIGTDVTLRVTEPTPVWAPADAPTQTVWLPGYDYRVDEGSTLRFPQGATIPAVDEASHDNESWLEPSSGDLEDLLGTYSLIIATFLGTMGLPHVLVRFYTNPDGKAARRTTVHVLLLLGLFYLFPTVLGALSRIYVPELLVTGRTDAAVLLLPSGVLPGVAGEILGAVVAAGAFAAFLSTSSGLLFSVAGVVATDLMRGRVQDFRWATVIVAVVPVVLAGWLLKPEDISLTVGMSFALAASTFCPVLVLGIWWRRLTWVGAVAGMSVGGALTLVALAINVVLLFDGGRAPWFTLQPALITVTAAFVTTIVVSRGTRRRLPAGAGREMLRLHAPDPLGLGHDRAVARYGHAEEKVRMGSGRHRRK